MIPKLIQLILNLMDFNIAAKKTFRIICHYFVFELIHVTILHRF